MCIDSVRREGRVYYTHSNDTDDDVLKSGYNSPYLGRAEWPTYQNISIRYYS